MVQGGYDMFYVILDIGMAIPFIVGTIIDILKPGIGCTLAWIVWIGLLIWHIIDRSKRESTKLK